MAPAYTTRLPSGVMARLYLTSTPTDGAAARADELLDWHVRVVPMQEVEIDSFDSEPGERVVQICGEIVGGDALAVDRVVFSQAVTERVSAHPLVTISREEIPRLPEWSPTIVATSR